MSPKSPEPVPIAWSSPSEEVRRHWTPIRAEPMDGWINGTSHSVTYKGPSIKYVMLFLANFDPLPPVTHPGTPPKVRHTSRTPYF